MSRVTQRRIEMLMSKNTAKEFMCPYSASGPKQFGCKGSRCAAFRWFATASIITGNKRVPLEKNGRGEELGYCSLTKNPDYIHLSNQMYLEREEETPI